MLAREIMRRKVITAGPEMTLQELAGLFIEEKISGAPVVDHEGRLLGVISQTDLVRRDREMSPELEIPSYYHGGDREACPRGFQIEDPDFTRVADVMTPVVLSAEEEAPVEEVARLMLRKHVHRVIITRHGRLSGIVTSMDMLKALLAVGEKAGAPGQV
jgi:CBS domain-containing protein